MIIAPLFMSCTKKEAPMKKNEVIIDFSQCNYIGELHIATKEALDFPDFYGENLDALWDAITGLVTLPERVILRGTKNVRAGLQEYMGKIITVFQRAESEYGQILGFTVIVE